MALKPDYVSASDLKTYLRVSGSGDDALIGTCVTAASRAVDHATGRQFGLASSAVARTYVWPGGTIDRRAALPIDDVQTSTGLVVTVGATTLTLGTDFDLWPLNAAGDTLPWTHLLLRSGGALGVWPTDPGGWPVTPTGVITVAGKWGWTTVPSLVVVATQIQAARFYARRSATFGIAGSPENGSELRLLERLDPDVAVALKPVKRWWGAV